MYQLQGKERGKTLCQHNVEQVLTNLTETTIVMDYYFHIILNLGNNEVSFCKFFLTFYNRQSTVMLNFDESLTFCINCFKMSKAVT